MVYLLAPEHPLNAHRGYLLHFMLPVRAYTGIRARTSEKPAVAQSAVFPDLRTSASQAGSGSRRRGCLPFLFPPGIAGRTLRSVAWAPVCFSPGVRHLALNFLSLYSLRHCSRAELSDPRDVNGRNVDGAATGAAQRAPQVGADFRDPA